ncbi:methanogen output domain 1-containing protein [Methanobacterium sp. ACI-7]|uniref:methanogen output domain 1-containing protein n=1 Tax=unclassified Methanobacterium TaxID=2627676 RepID=UPI0039C0ED5E
MDKSKILVIENESIIAMEIEQILKSNGYEAYLTRSNEDPVKRALEINPDMIIADTELNGQNQGINMVRKIKDVIDVSVIYLSSHSDNKTLESAKLTNACTYLLKPFQSNELTINIQLALYNHKKYAENNLILNKEESEDIQNFFSIVGSLLASFVPFTEKGSFLIKFSKYLEENIKEDFIKDLERSEDREIFKSYLSCLSRMLSNLGFTNKKISNESYGYIVVNHCPWENEMHSSDIFCLLCQSIAKITFSWANIEGKVSTESSFLSGAAFCKFRFDLK